MLESCFYKFCLDRSYQSMQADIVSCYCFIKHSCLFDCLPYHAYHSFLNSEADNLMQRYNFRY